MRMCHFWAQNSLFTLCKILKKFFKQIHSYEDVPFLGPKWSICHKQEFFWKKLLTSFSSIYWPHCPKFWKKILQQIQSYEDLPFWVQNGPFAPKNNFFRKTVKKPCSFCDAYLNSNPDINLLRKYWRLKNTEISLAESHFWL